MVVQAAHCNRGNSGPAGIIAVQPAAAVRAKIARTLVAAVCRHGIPLGVSRNSNVFIGKERRRGMPGTSRFLAVTAMALGHQFGFIGDAQGNAATAAAACGEC